MPPRIVQLASRYLNNPERISVASKQMTVPEVTQAFYEVPRNREIDALTRILDAEVPSLAMIFCRTKMMVDELGEALMARGYSAETLHGDLSQAQRDRVMRRFRTGQADILIATDVAARGLDIPDVSHVINYDIPESPETYVHRIGRTGRAGKSGTAITIVSPIDGKSVAAIEKLIGQSIGWADAPGRTEPAGVDRPPQHREHREQGRRHGGARGEHRGHGQAPSREPRAPATARDGTAKPRHAPPRPRPASESDGGHLPAFLLRPVRG
jgi:ATP-dependent RNA helicase DeaD